MGITERVSESILEDDLVEYRPESPIADDGEIIEESHLHEPSAVRIIYVCTLCYRQYCSVEDLRQHTIGYHNYVCEIPAVTSAAAALETAQIAAARIENSGIHNVENMGDQDPNIPTAIDENSSTVLATELRPVPFKDFRLILRSKMTIRCTVTYACAYKFESAIKLEQHTKCHQDHSNEPPFKCSECDVTAKNWRQCAAHLWKAHQIDVDLLHCPVCDYKAHASVLVWRHMRVHKKWRARVMRSLRAVQLRRKQNTQNTQQANTAAPSNKNRYYAEKTCDICSRKFVNGKTLSKHVKTVHNKIKPFICNVCGCKMARKAGLIIHMRQHTGEKPLQCRTCKFATRDPSVLHKHQLRHEKLGRFKCKLCDYACIQTHAYKRHMRLNHNDEYKKMSCELCGYASISEQKLEAHREDHRKGLIVRDEDSLDTRAGGFKNPHKLRDKNNEIFDDCFMPLESIDSLPHEPAVDTGGVTIPAPSEDTQFPTYLSN